MRRDLRHLEHQERPGKTALLSANWLVVLMTLRGWIMFSTVIPSDP